MAGQEALLFVGSQSGGLDLLELVGQELHLLWCKALLEQRLTALVQAGELLPGVLDCGEFGGVSAIEVQQTKLSGWLQEGVAFVGAMDVHQGVAEFLQDCGGDGGAIDEGAGAAFGEDASQEEPPFFPGRQGELLQVLVHPRPHGGMGLVSQKEASADFAGGGSAPNQRGTGTPARKETQCPQNQGFSCAGFARDGHQSRPKLQLELRDQDQVANVKGLKHVNGIFDRTLRRCAPPSPWCGPKENNTTSL